MMLEDEDLIEALAQAETAGWDELLLETEDTRIVLRRGASGGWQIERETLIAPRRLMRVSENEPEVATMPKQTAEETGAHFIRSRLIGAFYRSPKPGAPPFVDVGSNVGPDTIIGIVETMKLMNSVPAGLTGTIVEVRVADGEFVEIGHILMRVDGEPS